jgi:hypothetical protein
MKLGGDNFLGTNFSHFHKPTKNSENVEMQKFWECSNDDILIRRQKKVGRHKALKHAECYEPKGMFLR